jgi:hypothetical protein
VSDQRYEKRSPLSWAASVVLLIGAVLLVVWLTSGEGWVRISSFVLLACSLVLFSFDGWRTRRAR